MNRLTFLGIVERVLMTFGAAFLAMWLPSLAAVASGGTDWHAVIALSVLQKAALAGAAAVLTLVKSVVATQVGNPNSAGFLPDWVAKLFRVEAPAVEAVVGAEAAKFDSEAHAAEHAVTDSLVKADDPAPVAVPPVPDVPSDPAPVADPEPAAPPTS